VWAVEVIDEGEGKRKEGETVLTNTKIIKQNIKAREAQNHNRSARTTPSHLNSLVDNNFLHLRLQGCRGRRASCAENEAENVVFSVFF
jgi:hypothetical protein